MNQKKKKFIAIDGNSLLYRAFFAMRPLSTSDGLPTNAIYGLISMLLKVLEDKPDYIAVAFDTAVPTFRHTEYEKYKAHRKPPPDELNVQKPVARELLRAFNIPVVESDGFEADDIIGAMAKRAEQQGLEVMIVTGDLDALQLVTENVSVMTTVTGVTNTVIYGPDAVVARFGIRPDQLTDYKGLKGDSSDNIPGVPGIGDKTAIDLLTRYGTVENLLEHVSELPEGKVRKALEENVEIAILSKRLGTIITDIPLEFDIEDYRACEPDYDTLRDFFVRLEFKTMLKRLPEVSKAEGRMGPEERAILGLCRRINSPEELNQLIASIEKAGEFALQCHTANGKSIQAAIIGMSFCVGMNDTAYVEVIDPTHQQDQSLALGFESHYQADLSSLKSVLSSDKIIKYCHDSKLNNAALALRGVQLKGVVFDMMLGAYLLDSTRSSYNIGDVAFEQLSLELPGVTQKREDIEADDVNIVCGEAEAIYRLRPKIDEKLKNDGLYHLFTDVEMPIAPILAEMELTGVKIDFEQLGIFSTTLDVDIRALERDIFDLAGEEFNVGSPKQLQTILFEKLGMAASKKTKTGYSTNAAALEELASEYPIVEHILRYRELTKIKSTYADALPKLVNPRTGRVHTSLNQAVTATGRLSSSDPNLQNIPIRSKLGRQIRKAFIASNDNLLLSADYSQIELRILAHVTHDKELIRAFENDEDIHNATACTLFNCAPGDVTPEMRRRAKTINFAVIYGMSDFTLSKGLSMPVKEAREFINRYFDTFPGVRKYTEETIAKAREIGYVTTLLGRRRYATEINSANRNIRLNAERAAVNMPIQGTAADIMKIAMIDIHEAMKSANVESKMLLQVHDELVLEVTREECPMIVELVRKGMENAFKMRVPLKVDVKTGHNWSEMTPV